MKKQILPISVIVVVLLLGWMILGSSSSPLSFRHTGTAVEPEYTVDQSDMYSVEAVEAVNVDILTDEEKRWVMYMREEEKLARDVYRTLGSKYGLNIFSNIASSEQTHTDAVKSLLDRYKLNDPVTTDEVGVFTDSGLQDLYTSLVNQGNKSLIDALIVGATIEDLDIYDLDTALAVTQKADIVQVYKNLQKGSRNHLRAFIKNITARGGSYVPQYISKDLYQQILSGPQERGRI
jgi:hypothetical protein